MSCLARGPAGTGGTPDLAPRGVAWRVTHLHSLAELQIKAYHAHAVQPGREAVPGQHWRRQGRTGRAIFGFLRPRGTRQSSASALGRLLQRHGARQDCSVGSGTASAAVSTPGRAPLVFNLRRGGVPS